MYFGFDYCLKVQFDRDKQLYSDALMSLDSFGQEDSALEDDNNKDDYTDAEKLFKTNDNSQLACILDDEDDELTDLWNNREQRSWRDVASRIRNELRR